LLPEERRRESFFPCVETDFVYRRILKDVKVLLLTADRDRVWREPAGDYGFPKD